MEFLIYFHKNVSRFKLVEKQSSFLMRSINVSLKILSWIIGLFGKQPLAGGNFLGRYVTTVGRTIYSSPKWDYDKKPTPLVVHELTHVMQWSFRYAFWYLVSSKSRCYFESEAIQTEMLCFHNHLEEGADKFIERRARNLVAYGINFDLAKKVIGERMKENALGSPKKIPEKIRDEYIRWLDSTS